MFKFDPGSNSHALCDNIRLEFFEDIAFKKPYVNDNKVMLEEDIIKGEQRIRVNDTISFTPKTLYLRKQTRGKVNAYVVFIFEVCGAEKLSLKDPLSEVNRTFYF